MNVIVDVDDLGRFVSLTNERPDAPGRWVLFVAEMGATLGPADVVWANDPFAGKPAVTAADVVEKWLMHEQHKSEEWACASKFMAQT